MCSGPPSGCGITKWKHGCAFRSGLCVKFGFLSFAMHISKQKFKKREKLGVQCTLVPPSCYATDTLCLSVHTIRRRQLFVGHCWRPTWQSLWILFRRYFLCLKWSLFYNYSYPLRLIQNLRIQRYKFHVRRKFAIFASQPRGGKRISSSQSKFPPQCSFSFLHLLDVTFGRVLIPFLSSTFSQTEQYRPRWVRSRVRFAINQ